MITFNQMYYMQHVRNFDRRITTEYTVWVADEERKKKKKKKNLWLSRCQSWVNGSGYLSWLFTYYFKKRKYTFYILSQWVWFSLSIRSFIGSDQNSAHPLL